MHREMLDYREGQDLKSLNYTANARASEVIRAGCLFLFLSSFLEPQILGGLPSRGVTGGWAGWPIAHSDFDRIEGDAGLLLCNSHYAIGTLMQFWVLFLY